MCAHAYIGASCAQSDHIRANMWSVWTLLGPFWDFLGPSWGHLGADSSHPEAILGPILAVKEQGRIGKNRQEQRRPNSAKMARRLGESTIFDVPRSPVEAFLGQFWSILGSSWAFKAVLGPFSGFLEASWSHVGAFCAQSDHIRANLWSVWTLLGPFGDFLGPSWGHLETA